MRSILIACTLVVLLASGGPQPVMASSYANGLVSSGGSYIYQDGYWWKGDWAYTRSLQEYWYWQGCRRFRSTRWIYTRHHQRIRLLQPLQTEEWRRDLLQITREQLRWEQQLRQSQLEQKEFLEAVQALGLSQAGNRLGVNTAYPSNLIAPSFATANNPYMLYGRAYTAQAPYAAQGSTVYGYDSVASVYPNVDLKLLYNQANNLAQNSQALAAQATGDFSALVQNADVHRSEIARIIARGNAAAQVLELLRDRPEETRTHVEFLLKQDPTGNWRVTPRQLDDPTGVTPTKLVPPEPPDMGQTGLTDEDRTRLFGIIQTSCIQCHGPQKQESGLDMTQFLAFNQVRQREIVARLVTDDPEKQMPRGPGGVPGKRLSFPEIALFFRVSGLNPKIN